MIQQEQQLAGDGFDGGEEMKREGVSQQLDGEKESESDEEVRGVKMMETQVSSGADGASKERGNICNGPWVLLVGPVMTTGIND